MERWSLHLQHFLQLHTHMSGQKMVFSLAIKQELNEKAELKAIENIIKVSKTILKKSFDYSINVEGNPKKEEWNNYTIPLLIKINLNKNFDTFTKYFNMQ